MITLDLFGVFGDEITLERAVKAVDKAKASGKLKLRINSPGGDAHLGLAIYNLLKTSGLVIDAEVLGIAASAATLPLLAATTRRMTSNALVMIHESEMGGGGRADALDAKADALRKVNEAIVSVYTANTKLTRDDAVAQMTATTYMTAEEALASGFITEILDGGMSAEAATQIAAHLKGAPAPFIAAVTKAAQAKDTALTTLQEILDAVDKLTPEEKAKVASAAGGDSKGASHDNPPPPFALGTAVQALAAVETTDEALGVVRAWKASAAQVTELQKQVDELTAKAVGDSLELVFASEPQRSTPGVRKLVKEAFDKKEITIEGARAWVKSSPVVVTAQKRVEAGVEGNGTGLLTYKGKSWKELAPAARAELKREDLELHNQMRTGAANS